MPSMFLTFTNADGAEHSASVELSEVQLAGILEAGAADDALGWTLVDDPPSREQNEPGVILERIAERQLGQVLSWANYYHTQRLRREALEAVSLNPLGG